MSPRYSSAVPDRPTTPSINMPKNKKKLRVEIKTADAILTAKSARKKASVLIEKSRQVEAETLDLVHRLEEEEHPPKGRIAWLRWWISRRKVRARARARRKREKKEGRDAKKQAKAAEKARWAALARGEDVPDIHGDG